MQILVFRLKDLFFGISTESVQEITKTHQTTNIPKSPEWVQGLVNLRGEVLTLVNLYSLLKIDDFNIEDCYNNTIIVQTTTNNVALMVDEIIGVTDVAEDTFQAATGDDDSSIQALATVYDQVVSILDLNSLFEETEG